MNSRERVLCALSRKEPDRIPFVEHEIDPYVLKALFGAKAADPVFVADELGLDIMTFIMLPPLFVDEHLLPDGRKHQTNGKLHSRKDIHLLDSLVDPVDPKLYESLEWLVSHKGDRAVVAKMRLGISAMLMSMDLMGFSMALMDDPELILLILRRYVKWCKTAVEQVHKRGADVLWFFDDIAYRSGPMMSPKIFCDLLLPDVKELTRNFPLPWIYHSDGDLRPVLDDLLSLGMNGLHPIEPECMSLKDIKAIIGEKVCLVGNVSVDVLGCGSTIDVEKEVRRCFCDGGKAGYMITSSNSIPSYALPENVMVMAQTINKLNSSFNYNQ